MKFVIRDDDISYYTNVNELKKIYSPVFKNGFKVSYSIIPKEVKTIHKDNRMLYKQFKESRFIGENIPLVKYLKSKINNNSIEIMLHGFDHRYQINNGKFKAEANYKNTSIFERNISNGIKYLNNLFNTSVVTFVPPSNQISPINFLILEQSKVKYISGTITPFLNRPLNKFTLINYIKYISYKTFYNHSYPYVLNNRRIKEITYYSLTPKITTEALINHFNFCLNKSAPFVLSTHHWELISNKKMLNTFYKFLEFIDTQNITKCLFKDIFE